MLRGLVIAATLAGMSVVGAVQARPPSFSCTGLLRSDERAICRSSTLSAQDRELAAMFDAIKGCKAMGGRDLFIGEQARWLKQRRACGASRACLSRLYRHRLAELRPQAIRAGRFSRAQECPAL